MTPPPRNKDRLLRRILPRSLMGRSMLIVLLPLLVTQIIVLVLFYGTYLNVVSRRLSDGMAQEIALAITMIERHPQGRNSILAQVSRQTGMEFLLHPSEHPVSSSRSHVFGPIDEDFGRALSQTLSYPFSMDWHSARYFVLVRVALTQGVLEVRVPRKRLDIEPVWLFFAWAVSASVLLFWIAGLFMRNQVRAIHGLAQAVELFGLGRDQGPVRPRGAREVRQAALAFNRMQERINRFVTQRTVFLAGVSHDLRTPLTRLRLTVAMLPLTGKIDAGILQPDIADMIADIGDMERLIGSYLSFARGEGAEAPIKTELRALMEDVAVSARRAGGEVLEVSGDGPVEILVRPDALRRALTNLADNARRHGGAMRFSLRVGKRRVEILVEDDGPGLSPKERERIFRIFQSGTSQRDDGRGGLGLIIVRDVIHAHGGSIHLEKSALGGLSVRLSLPR